MELQLDTIVNAECLEHLKQMPDNCLDCVITSPPYYGLRDYGCDGQVGLEDTPEDYVQRLVDIFHEVNRCLKPTGTLWLNLGDSYCGTGDKGNYQDPKYKNGRNGQAVAKNKIVQGCKKKDLIGIPWMVAFALRADGWYLRQDIIWAKPNPMPESVKDRCTKSHEYIFLLTKSPKYYFDYEAIQEEATGYDGRKDTMLKGSPKYATEEIVPKGVKRQTMAARGHQRWKFKNLADKGQQPNSMHLRRADGAADEQYPVRNKRDVWSVCPKPSSEAHYAMYPEELVKYCVEAGSPIGGVVFDPFMGSGTTAAVAKKFDRHYYGTELNPKFYEIATRRVSQILSFI